MNIALIGYGKMGQIIEKFAIDRNHEIVLIVDENNRDQVTVEELQQADVAIDFSTPSAVLENIEFCFRANVPLVVGTTGRSEEHTSELQSLMRISYAVFCLKKKNIHNNNKIV